MQGTHTTRRYMSYLAVLAVLVFCLRTFSDNKADVDLWGNVGFVKAMPWSAAFHDTNTYSFTEPHRPWVNHEWLAEYILHHVHAALGNTGLLALKILLGLLVVSLLNHDMAKECRSGILRFLLLLLVVSTMGYGFSTRPHLFTYVLLTMELIMLRQCRLSSRVPLLFMPALAVVWVNLHGAFFVGALLGAVFSLLVLLTSCRGTGASAPARRRGLTLLAGTGLFLAATLMNPYGWRTWEFIMHSAAVPRPYLSEWAPFHLGRHLMDHPDFVLLALLSLACLGLRPLRREPARAGILLLAFAAALLLRRNIPLFAITAAVIIPGPLDSWAAPRLRRLTAAVPAAAMAAALAVFILLCAHAAWFMDKTDPLEIEVPQDRFPVDTVRFMKVNGIRGNALVFFDWAEYCIWKLFPQCRVFMDGRFLSAYSAPVARQYFDFLYLEKGWQRALTDYPTTLVLIHKGNPAAMVMPRVEGWSLAHEGRIALLYIKTAAHPDLAARLTQGGLTAVETAPKEYFP